MKEYKTWVVVIILALLFQSCCRSDKGWSFTIQTNDWGNYKVLESDYNKDYKQKESTSTCEGLPFEIILYNLRVQVIDQVEITGSDGRTFLLTSKDLINPVCLNADGTLEFDDSNLVPKVVSIKENEIVRNAASILDITATVSSALGLGMSGLGGSSLLDNQFKHVVLIYLDGLSDKIFQKASRLGLTSNIEAGATVIPAITIYPPRSNTATAAVLTGLSPQINGVYKGGITSTKAATLFDKAAEKGLSTVAIEGQDLPFEIRSTKVIVSSDSDQNGFSDDNTFKNTMDRLGKSVPALTWIHFHGIDECGHKYGPSSDAVFEKIAEIDGYIGQILKILPKDTLVIIFSDHGMHRMEDDKGKHGNLIESDMVVPILIKLK